MLINECTESNILKYLLRIEMVVCIVLGILLTGCSKGSSELENIPDTNVESKKYETDHQTMENLVLQEIPLNKKEALDILFTHLYVDGEGLKNLVFVDDDKIAYRWDTLVNAYIYLQEKGYSEDEQYIVFMLWESVFNPEDGTQYLWHWLNEFAVNVYTGEIMECMDYDEYGVKYYGYDYYKYIKKEEVDVTEVIKEFDYSLLFETSVNMEKFESSKTVNSDVNILPGIFSNYAHKEYEWMILKENDNLQACEELEEYLETFRKIILDERYLKIDSSDGYKEFVGDEKLIEGTSKYYSVDMFNCGEKVIFEKRIHYSILKKNKFSWEPIFYLYDGEKQERMEVYRLDSSNKSESRCVQLWFKELNGYVYTFVILQIEEEYYLFNVYAIDKFCGLEYDVNLVHQELIWPAYE